jgi:hypothetical protein
MAGPAWLDAVFGALFALLALYFAVRLIASRGTPGADRAGELAHLLMSVGMAAMFLPAFDPLPQPVWLAVFVLNAAWLATSLLRADPTCPHETRAHQAHLVVSSGAMAYMVAIMSPAAPAPAVAMAASSSGPALLAHDHGGGGGLAGIISLALGAYFVLHAVWSAGRVARGRATEPAVPAVPAPVGPAPAGPVLVAPQGLLHSPRLTGSCHVVMGLGMGYMLLAMAG